VASDENFELSSGLSRSLQISQAASARYSQNIAVIRILSDDIRRSSNFLVSFFKTTYEQNKTNKHQASLTRFRGIIVEDLQELFINSNCRFESLELSMLDLLF
jgi:hypothetical protein